MKVNKDILSSLHVFTRTTAPVVPQQNSSAKAGLSSESSLNSHDVGKHEAANEKHKGHFYSSTLGKIRDLLHFRSEKMPQTAAGTPQNLNQVIEDKEEFKKFLDFIVVNKVDHILYLNFLHQCHRASNRFQKDCTVLIKNPEIAKKFKEEAVKIYDMNLKPILFSLDKPKYKMQIPHAIIHEVKRGIDHIEDGYIVDPFADAEKFAKDVLKKDFEKYQKYLSEKHV